MMPSSLEHLGHLFLPLWQLSAGILVCTIPLWWVVAKTKFEPLLKLLLTTLMNFVFMYFLEFGAHLLSLPQWVPLTILIISLLYSAYILIQRKLEFPWTSLLAWLGLSIWILGLQSWITVYGAASWYGDWYEHYERSIWFFEQQPSHQRFLFSIWPLSARGPLFNAICAMLMNCGSDFASFQVFATVLNTFPVLPFAILIRHFGRLKTSSSLLWSILICAIAPFAVQQETYTWTKLFTSGILLNGIYFYNVGLSEDNPLYIRFSFAAFAIALLAHYLSIIFILFFMIHFLITLISRKWNPRLIISIFLICSALAGTWFAYLIVELGLKTTLTANSTFSAEYETRQQGVEGEIPSRWLVFAGNMLTTTIPYNWRGDWSDTWHGIGIAKRLKQRDARMGERFSPQEDELDLQNEWFAHLVTYPNSLLGGIGYAGMMGLMIFLLRGIKRKSRAESRSRALFWALFFLCVIPLNILAERNYSSIGVAHLNMQTFFFLAGVLLIRELQSLQAIRALIIAIFLIEASIISGAWISLQERKLPILVRENGTVVIRDKVHADAKYVSNYLYKLQVKAVYLSDKLGRLNIPFFFMTTALATGSCLLLRKYSTDQPILPRRSVNYLD